MLIPYMAHFSVVDLCSPAVCDWMYIIREL